MRIGPSGHPDGLAFVLRTDLQYSTAQHAELLSTSLDDTDVALKLVNLQLAGLLAAAADDEGQSAT